MIKTEVFHIVKKKGILDICAYIAQENFVTEKCD